MKKNIFKRIETNKELPLELKKEILGELPKLEGGDLLVKGGSAEGPSKVKDQEEKNGKGR